VCVCIYLYMYIGTNLNAKCAHLCIYFTIYIKCARARAWIVRASAQFEQLKCSNIHNIHNQFTLEPKTYTLIDRLYTVKCIYIYLSIL
jgi:hypothetical protein